MAKQLVLALLTAAALVAPQAAAQALEKPVLIINETDIPLATPDLEQKLHHALYWGGIRTSSEIFDSLEANVVDALASAGPHMSIVCSSGDALCVTLIRK